MRAVEVAIIAKKKNNTDNIEHVHLSYKINHIDDPVTRVLQNRKKNPIKSKEVTICFHFL